ncbi:MAG: ankyrin repeat domain-containing protein, partial [Proteobacteria bacterium]|nr:ankyrin repeat domain-containing protein [Pseudomonadota bacterium]
YAVSDAASFGNFELVKFLVEHGGKICDWCVSKAASFGNFELIKFLVEHSGKIGNSAVSRAASTGNFELVEFLVKCGGKIDDYAVSRAASAKNFELVKFLVEHGGNIGDSAVSNAARTGNFEFVKFLVEHGGKIDDWSVSNAASAGNFELAEFLLKNCNDPDKISNQAVISAALEKNSDAVKFFMNHGANVNETILNVINSRADGESLALAHKIYEIYGSYAPTTQQKFQNEKFLISTMHGVGNETIAIQLDGFANLKQKATTYIYDKTLYAKDTVLTDIIDKVYVIDANGNLFSAPPSTKGHFHSYILNHEGFGMPVAAAGHINVMDGKVTRLDNCSGHYTPTKDQVIIAAKYLYEQGVLAPNAEISTKCDLNMSGDDLFSVQDVLNFNATEILNSYPVLDAKLEAV